MSFLLQCEIFTYDLSLATGSAYYSPHWLLSNAQTIRDPVTIGTAWGYQRRESPHTRLAHKFRQLWPLALLHFSLGSRVPSTDVATVRFQLEVQAGRHGRYWGRK